jgi:hypothetical protein
MEGDLTENFGWEGDRIRVRLDEMDMHDAGERGQMSRGCIRESLAHRQIHRFQELEQSPPGDPLRVSKYNKY